MPIPTRDRFDDLPPAPHRIGVHRAENPRVRALSTFLWALAATVVLVGAGILLSLIGQGKIDLFPAADPTAAAVPTVAPVIDTSYSLLVLNGTPEEGLATTVKSELEAAGWTEQSVVAGNASSRDYPESVVYYAAPEAEAAARGVADLIGTEHVVLDADYPLPDTSADQLTIVLGTDRMEGAEPTPAP